MTVFITGGCKNGKSTFALRQALRLAGEGKRCYVATMLPCDAHEWECVRRHRAAREGMGFETVERGRDLAAILADTDPDATYLIDSVTALLSNEMFPADGGADEGAAARVEADLARILGAVRHCVVVSDYIYSDGGAYSALSEQFRRGLARLDCFLAARCDCVVEICGGIPTVHKGTLPDNIGEGETK